MKFMAEWFNLTIKFLDVEISVKNGIIETDHSVKPTTNGQLSLSIVFFMPFFSLKMKYCIVKHLD